MRRFTASLFTLGLLLGITASATDAQTIGFKLGAAFPNLSIENGTSDRMTTFTGGGHIRFGLGRLGVQAEILSVTKGASFSDGEDDVELRLEYVEIPLLLHIPLAVGGSFAPYVFGGPSIGLEVRCRLKAEGGSSVDCDDADTFGRRSTDFGVHAGGGLAFAMGPGALLVEGRYAFGLSNLVDQGTGTVRTRTPSVMVGYEIPLGRTW
jgi:hypothetical protein